MAASERQIIDSLRENAVSPRTFDPWRAPRREVLALYAKLGLRILGVDEPHPDGPRVILPAEYDARGRERSIALKKIDLPDPRPEGDPKLAALRWRVLRLLAVLLLLPGQDVAAALRRNEKLHSAYSWRTWQHDATALCECARLALATSAPVSPDSCPDGSAFLQGLRKPVLMENASYRKEIFHVNLRLGRASRLGLIEDWPALDLPEWSREALKTARAATRGRQPKPAGQNEFEPFLDADLGTVLQTCLTLSALTHDLVLLQSDLIEIRELRPWNLKEPFLEALVKFKGKHLPGGRLPLTFRTKDGRLLTEIGAHMRPVTFLRTVAFAIQTAHQQLLNLLFMMRGGEVPLLPYDAVEKRRDGDLHVLTSRFVKGAMALGGDVRDWPAAPLVLTILRRQQCLKNAFATDEEGWDGLWIQTGDNPDDSYARFWKYWTNPDGTRLIPLQSMAPTRFRASGIRLVVLAEIGGETIAREIAGHDTVITTMGYANARGDLRSEMIAVRLAVERAMGTVLLSDFRDGRLPKRSRDEVATSVDGLDQYLEAEIPAPGLIPSAIRLLGTSDFSDIADHLGKGARMTAPGVFCNRRDDQIGACRDVVRKVNPGQCNDHKECTYRMETGAYLTDQAGRIDSYLGMLDESGPHDPRDFSFYSVMVALLDCFFQIEGEVAERLGDTRLRDAVFAIDTEMMAELNAQHQLAVAAIREHHGRPAA